ncbi:nucleotidyltransferase family protein [Polaribacter aquimarinus]|uniref:Nucleotidyltransferase n=1 Tax=Polaribacter aquimarinus TaxID=2100726 RepID=A0A2U2JDX8_9FLAO|nr:nucleotidyltransferase family protein [Polaribacter aquimarinus]PWG06550.1 hypothetical protein DIS07_01570 [Polaribacter aquimarinus]
MNYKETLFFIGKCLTINYEAHNYKIIENLLKSGNIDWDPVVKVSTNHYVFPALYCNLKRAHFLHYLPKDLVEFMKHITDLNRERNEQIIAQAKEINEILIDHNITPIFLKGTGNLLEGLYEDIAERMVGDIDFLVSDKNYKNTITILESQGYSKDENQIDTTFVNRHYPKIVHKKRIGALEIHFKMVLAPYDDYFNFKTIKSEIKKINSIAVLSFKDQILMTSFNQQINNHGVYLKSISLRGSYDLFLLSKKASTISALKKVSKYFNQLNSFIASTSRLFNNPESLVFERNNESDKFISKQLFFIENTKAYSKNKKNWELYFLYKSRLSIFLKMFYNKENRQYVIDRIFKK